MTAGAAPRERVRTAVLISGRGSNLMSLAAAASEPRYPASIDLVLSNRPEAPGLTWAREKGLAAVAIDHTAFAGRGAFEAAMQRALEEYRIGLVACAGFMRLMTAPFVECWHGRMVNIHPSLLPSFKGTRVHEQALAAGVRIAGCTVHFVAPEMDAGPIIAQAAVPVLETDTAPTLAARVLAAEHRLYPYALGLVASGRARLEAGRVLTGAAVNQSALLLSPWPDAGL
jgi:phosphoribosylglycinamide formyltransferase-1